MEGLIAGAVCVFIFFLARRVLDIWTGVKLAKGKKKETCETCFWGGGGRGFLPGLVLSSSMTHMFCHVNTPSTTERLQMRGISFFFPPDRVGVWQDFGILGVFAVIII